MLTISETEEGFVKLFSKKDDLLEEMEEVSLVRDEEQVEEEEEEEGDCLVFQSLRQVIKVCYFKYFTDISHFVVTWTACI